MRPRVRARVANVQLRRAAVCGRVGGRVGSTQTRRRAARVAGDAQQLVALVAVVAVRRAHVCASVFAGQWVTNQRHNTSAHVVLCECVSVCCLCVRREIIVDSHIACTCTRRRCCRRRNATLWTRVGRIMDGGMAHRSNGSSRRPVTTEKPHTREHSHTHLWPEIGSECSVEFAAAPSPGEGKNMFGRSGIRLDDAQTNATR